MQISIKQYTHGSWKLLLRLLICLQLCLGSYPAYPIGGNDKWTDPEDLLPIVEFLSNVGIHIEAGTLDSYLKEHSEVKERADYYYIGSQFMEVIQYDIVEESPDNLSPDQKQIRPATIKVPRVHRTISLNDYTEHPPDIQVTETKIQYSHDTKTLIFEGLVDGRVVLKQYVPGLDVTTYVEDPEMLLLMDRKKGILLIDMAFTKEYLGRLPIPVIPIPTRILESSSTQLEGLYMEFLIPGRTVMPDVPEEFEPIMDVNGLPLIRAGDFIVSYDDFSNNKTLHQYINRTELYGWIEETHHILRKMMMFVAPELMANREHYNKFVDGMTVQEGTLDVPISGYIVSALFTKHAIRKFMHAMDGMSARVRNLELHDQYVLNIEDWNRGIEKLKTQEGAFSEQAVVESSNQIAPSQKTSDLQKSEEDVRSMRIRAFRKLAFVTSKSKSAITHDVTKVIGGSFLTAFSGALLFPEQYTAIMNYMLHLFQYQDKGTAYAFTTMVNLVSLGLFVPAVAVLLSSGLPYYYKGKAKIINFFSNLLSKDFPSEGKAYEQFEEWSNLGRSKDSSLSRLTRLRQFVNLNKFVGVSLKTVAVTILPVWERITGVVGQPHFFSALQKGLNPLKKIDPESNVGQLMQSKGMELSKPTRLGSQGWIPHWRWLSENRYYQHRELQSAYETQNSTIKSVAWVMATLAVAGHEEVNPEELLLYGATIHREDRLRVLSDADLKLELDWVMLSLIHHLKKTESVDWNGISNPQMIEALVLSYDKAKLLAKRFKSRSRLARFVSRFIHSDHVKKFRGVVNIPAVASWNKRQRQYLEGVPLEFVVGRAAPEAFWDNLVTSTISVTYSGEDGSRANLKDIPSFGQDSSNFLFGASPAHINDMGQNWTAHLLVASGRTALTFMETSNRIEEAHQAAQQLYQVPIPELNDYKQRFFSYMYHGLVYPFISGGDKNNLGDVLLRQEKSRLRLIQLNLLTFIGLRSMIVDQPFSEIIMAAVMYYFAALWIFGWPWVVLQSGARLNHDYLQGNSERIKKVIAQFVNVSNGVFSYEEDFREAYHNALSNLFDLYVAEPQSRLMRTMRKVIKESRNHLIQNMLKDVGFSDEEIQMFMERRFTALADKHNITNIQNVSKIFVEHIAKHPPLPTKENGVGKNVSIFYFGAFLSTVLALSLLVKTYQTDWLTVSNLLFWIGVHILGTVTVYKLWKRGLIRNKEVDGEHIKSFKNIAVDGARDIRSSIRTSCQKVLSHFRSKK